MKDNPIIYSKHSLKVEVQKGKKYLWCACGKSSKQPFCDGSHKETSFKPIEYIAEKDGLIGFCGCKLSKKGPVCDGTHKNI